MTDHTTDIRDTVRDYYAAHARKGSSCCDTSSDESRLYSLESLAELPADIAGFSLGCGDPITLADLRAGETVLDLGSGGGLDCFLAAKKVGESGRVIGVDMTPEMIEKARHAAARLGASRVEFRQGYLEALPVEDASIDVVISNCVINLSPDKNRVFQEIYRVLKPGGRVAVSDILFHGEVPATLKDDPQAWSACVAGAVPAEQYTGGLVKAGLTDVRIQLKESSINIDLFTVGTPYSALISARKLS